METLASLFGQSFEPVKAPIFIPKYPEKRTIARKPIVPGSSRFMPQGSLRSEDVDIIAELDELDELIEEGENVN